LFIPNKEPRENEVTKNKPQKILKTRKARTKKVRATGRKPEARKGTKI